MTTVNNTVKEERKSNLTSNLFSKRVTWNGKRRHNYKYITSVF